MAVTEEPKKNETYKPVGRGNYLPSGLERIEPKNMGDLGVRLMIDTMLSAVDGMGVEQLAAMGVSMRDVAKHRKTIERILLSVIENDSRRLHRQQATGAAIRLAGHLRITSARPALVSLLNAVHERPILRAAAADALGLMRADNVEDVLQRHIDDPSDQVARSAIIALEKVGTEQNLDTLKRRRAATTNLTLLRDIHAAIRAIEVRAKLEPSVEEIRFEKRDKSSYSQILNDGAVFERLFEQ